MWAKKGKTQLDNDRTGEDETDTGVKVHQLGSEEDLCRIGNFLIFLPLQKTSRRGLRIQ